MMKRLLYLTAFLFCTGLFVHAQVGKTVSNIKLSDVNDELKSIPFYGKKVFVVFYVDPDVSEYTDPLSDTLNARKYPKNKFDAFGIVNLKDTWLPNSVIFSMVRQKQKKFPNALIMLDKNHTVPNSWGLGNCNGTAMVLVIGTDTKIKFQKAITSSKESKSIVPAVLRVIEAEIKN